MAENGIFGKKIPSLGQIVKIDGDQLIDNDGDDFSRNIVRINDALGGGLELVKIVDESEE